MDPFLLETTKPTIALLENSVRRAAWYDIPRADDLYVHLHMLNDDGMCWILPGWGEIYDLYHNSEATQNNKTNSSVHDNNYNPLVMQL